MTSRAPRTRYLVCAVLLGLVPVLTAAQAAPLRVVASNGVKTFVDALVPSLEKASGRKLALTYGTSSGLVKDILGGAPFDVVIATSDSLDTIGKAGKLAAGTTTTVGHASVGVGVRQGAKKPAIHTAAEMKQALLDAKGITYAGDGASRPHIEAMFATLGIADTVKGKTILEQGSVRAAARVNAGDADMLITLVSEILPSPGLELVGPLPKEFTSAVSFAAGAGAAASDPEAARALVAALVSPDSTPTLRQKGLER
jgi:molybdate transport system substrate-binding protein